MTKVARGRPRRFSEYDRFVEKLPRPMGKRPHYLKGVGVFRGHNSDTAWVKIRLPNGATYKGKTYPPGKSLEIKLGNLSSWTWEQLVSKHTELQGRADRGEPLEEAPAILFEAWAKEWLERAQRRIRNFETEEVNVRVHLLPYFGPKPLITIRVQDVNRWIANQLKELAPGTVKRQLNTLKAILNDALRAGHIEANPCNNAEPIRGMSARRRFLDHEELLGLLAAAEKVVEWLPDWILWCIHSGMRKEEIRALDWSDIQLLDDDRQFVIVRTSKAGEPRLVHCTRTMTEILERQKARKLEGDNHVFPVTKMTLRRKWEKARKRAGLADVTMHDLRRTHSTHAAAAGVDLRTLAARIGHSDLTMLQNHYAAIVGSAAKDAADTIQGVFDRIVKN